MRLGQEGVAVENGQHARLHRSLQERGCAGGRGKRPCAGQGEGREGAKAELRDGRLVRVLEPFSPTSPGLFLYFPSRAQTQPKLRAFIDVALMVLRRTGVRR
jgi:hypothetical protein